MSFTEISAKLHEERYMHLISEINELDNTLFIILVRVHQCHYDISSTGRSNIECLKYNAILLDFRQKIKLSVFHQNDKNNIIQIDIQDFNLDDLDYFINLDQTKMIRDVTGDPLRDEAMRRKAKAIVEESMGTLESNISYIFQKFEPKL